ncbi:hypothetical protein BDY19DRAFT_995884 [Irpex rosettiformis]|uniref:Uncharacterized protein n=1 Tax=Irpex rosettiformis TaxID=378272 RepID=A0ACB8TX31_9APHY|nr:hypothetical protein BDY19DRAFT_995884 [Irpex rosettiformis]
MAEKKHGKLETVKKYNQPTSSMSKRKAQNLGPKRKAELEHRQAKQFYSRTSRKGYEEQIGIHVCQEKLLHSISRLEEAAKKLPASHEPESDRDTAAANSELPRKRGRSRKEKARSNFDDVDPLTNASFHAHHYMSDSTRLHEDDPTVKDFVTLLKNYLIARLVHRAYNGAEENYSHEEWLKLHFEHNHFYEHKILAINYTTYDLCCD